MLTPSCVTPTSLPSPAGPPPHCVAAFLLLYSFAGVVLSDLHLSLDVSTVVRKQTDYKEILI